jgi:hypothetical protein
MEWRRNARVRLRTRMSLEGVDRWGKPFHVTGESVDFSRNGMGLMIEPGIVSPGCAITVKTSTGFEADAAVRWSRPGARVRQRIGVRFLRHKAGAGIRIAASILLCMAILGQAGYSRSRFGGRGRQAATASCNVSLERMKTALQNAFREFALLTESDKAFLHIQHERLGCGEYTRLYENSDFFPDARVRAALANWHWTVYHASDATVRSAAVRQIEAMLQPAH